MWEVTTLSHLFPAVWLLPVRKIPCPGLNHLQGDWVEEYCPPPLLLEEASFRR